MEKIASFSIEKKRISLPITALERKLYFHLHKTWSQYILGFLCPVSTAFVAHVNTSFILGGLLFLPPYVQVMFIHLFQLRMSQFWSPDLYFPNHSAWSVLLHHTSCSTLSQENTDLGTIHYYLSLLCLPGPLTRKMFISVR